MMITQEKRCEDRAGSAFLSAPCWTRIGYHLICWDGVGSWREMMLVGSCKTLVKTLFLFLILLLCTLQVFGFVFVFSRMGLHALSKPLGMMIHQ